MNKLERVWVAVVQMNSGGDVQANVSRAREMVRRAADRGAGLVCLPENWSFMGSNRRRMEQSQPLDGPLVAGMAELALRHRIHLLLGSVPECSGIEGERRIYNTSVLLGPEGEVVASYRKIHLFDSLVDSGPAERESDGVLSGDRVVLADTGLGTIGMSICYDLRFPELYRQLSRGGAKLLTVPAAFTYHTGKDHWETLLRARAIENACYVIAPNQYGMAGDACRCYGRSMIVDPWGNVVSRASDGENIAWAELDMGLVDETRRNLPALDHRRI